MAKSLNYLSSLIDKELLKERKIVVFGGMGTGKSTLTDYLVEGLQSHGYKVYSYNIGDTCRLFMKIGTVNSQWKDDTRVLGQTVASKLREIDVNILNDVVLSKIKENVDNESDTEKVIHIITGGRTVEDFKYWESLNSISIGVISDKNTTKDRLNTRDVGQIQSECHMQHETERDTEYISKELCCEIVNNNKDLKYLKEEAHRVIQKHNLI